LNALITSDSDALGPSASGKLAAALAEDNDQLGRAIGEPLWPEEKSLVALRQEQVILGARDWNALYQQHPTTEEGAIIKSAYWRKWPEKKPPIVEFVVHILDCAFEEAEENDYSARTTWGIFDIFHQDTLGCCRR